MRRINQALWQWAAAQYPLIVVTPTVTSITSTAQTESTAITHNVVLSATVGGVPATYAFAITPITASAGSDYNATPTFGSSGVTLSGGNLTVPVGVFSFPIIVATSQDAVYEGTESYSITVAGVTNTVNINDDDSAPTVLSVSSASGYEGYSVLHTVAITGTAQEATSFALSLSGGTATAGVDYTSTLTNSHFSASVTISGGNISVPSGVTSFQVFVPALTDALTEGNETYTLTIGGASGTGTIMEQLVPGTLTYGATADAGEVDTPWTAPTWSDAVAYNPSDMVNNGGSKFWAIKAVPIATATSNTTYWQPVTTVYYIDADNGLDSYNGLSHYPGYITNTDGSQGTANAAYGPWQTVEKVTYKVTVGYWDTVAANGNTYPLNHAPWVPAQAGNMFLFKRGTTAKYIGQLQVSAWNTALGTGIGDFLFGAYGTGSRPLIEHNTLSARYNIDRGIFWTNKANVKVRNMAFDGLYDVADPGNTLHLKRTGIDPSASPNFSFVNSSVTRSGGDGLLIGSTSTYAYIKNSTFSYCGLGGHPGNGVGGGATGGLVENLTVSHCGVDALLTHGIYIAHWDEFTVRRCDVSYSANFGINSGAHGANPLIEENYIHDNLNGIDLGSSSYNTDQYYTGTLRIRGNIICNNGNFVAGNNGNAIYTINFCTDALIANNLIYGNRGDGITVHRPTMTGFAQRPTSNVKIHNNTIHSAYATRCVRFLDPVTASSVRNNIMYGTHSGVDGVMQDANMVLSELTLTNNLYYFPNKANPQHVANLLGTQTTLASMQGSGYESGSLVGNPLFTTAGSDFTLQAGSPAKLAGYTSGIALDLLRSARNATTPSIGAYE